MHEWKDRQALPKCGSLDAGPKPNSHSPTQAAINEHRLNHKMEGAGAWVFRIGEYWQRKVQFNVRNTQSMVKGGQWVRLIFFVHGDVRDSYASCWKMEDASSGAWTHRLGRFQLLGTSRPTSVQA